MKLIRAPGGGSLFYFPADRGFWLYTTSQIFLPVSVEVCFISPLIGDFDLKPSSNSIGPPKVCFISPLIGDFDARISVWYEVDSLGLFYFPADRGFWPVPGRRKVWPQRKKVCFISPLIGDFDFLLCSLRFPYLSLFYFPADRGFWLIRTIGKQRCGEHPFVLFPR